MWPEPKSYSDWKKLDIDKNLENRLEIFEGFFVDFEFIFEGFFVNFICCNYVYVLQILKIRVVWKKLKGSGIKKKSSFLASKLNKPVVSHYTPLP